jgi:hypothetical protein
MNGRVALGAFALLLFGVTGAQAQATRTWVSGVGDDANPCSRTAPCKTFAGAISKTATAGEIDVLDPGGFGALTITKSLTIDGSAGVVGSILVAGTNGITVNAAGSVVTIRNLSINGTGTGLIGIRILAAKDVYIENCEIFGFGTGAPNGRGISDERTAAGRLFVTDTVVRNNGHSGIVVAPAGALVSAALEGVRIEGNVAGGFAITGGAKATVSHSVASGNGAGGFYADGNGGISEMSLAHSVSSHNGTGVTSQVGAIVRITDVTVSYNTNGLTTPAGGLIYSYGDNTIDGNGTNGAPSGSLGKQ